LLVHANGQCETITWSLENWRALVGALQTRELYTEEENNRLLVTVLIIYKKRTWRRSS
jgi:hypothetical protein